MLGLWLKVLAAGMVWGQGLWNFSNNNYLFFEFMNSWEVSVFLQLWTKIKVFQ